MFAGLLTVKPAPDAVALEIVTFFVPATVSVTSSEVVEPTATGPKLTEEELGDSCAAAALPLPVPPAPAGVPVKPIQPQVLSDTERASASVALRRDALKRSCMLLIRDAFCRALLSFIAPREDFRPRGRAAATVPKFSFGTGGYTCPSGQSPTIPWCGLHSK